MDLTTVPPPELVRVAPEDLYADYAQGRPWDDREKINAYQQAKMLDASKAWVPPRYRNAHEMPVKAQAWADGIAAGADATNLVLMGPPGTGKTHGSCAVARYLTTLWEDRHAPSALMFTSASDLLARMKDYGKDADRQGAYDKASCAKVLILDDLARSKTTDVDVESYARVLDRRLNALLPTIVTTNVFPKENLIETFGDHLASRLLGGSTLVLVGGPDRRYATV